MNLNDFLADRPSILSWAGLRNIFSRPAQSRSVPSLGNTLDRGVAHSNSLGLPCNSWGHASSWGNSGKWRYRKVALFPSSVSFLSDAEGFSSNLLHVFSSFLDRFISISVGCDLWISVNLYWFWYVRSRWWRTLLARAILDQSPLVMVNSWLLWLYMALNIDLKSIVSSLRCFVFRSL